MADGYRAVAAQQEECHGLAHNVGPSNHHAVLSLGVNVILVQDLHDAIGGAGQEPLPPDEQGSHAHGMEPVHVLLRRDGQEDGLLINPLRQRELTEDAVDIGPTVEFLNEGNQLCLGGLLRQGILLAEEPALFTVLPLAVDIDPAGRVVPYDDDR